MQRLQANMETYQKTLLYRTVFDGVFIKYVIVCMGIFFLIHPVIPVFASEETDLQSNAVEEAEVQPQVEEFVIEPEPEPESSASDGEDVSGGGSEEVEASLEDAVTVTDVQEEPSVTIENEEKPKQEVVNIAEEAPSGEETLATFATSTDGSSELETFLSDDVEGTTTSTPAETFGTTTISTSSTTNTTTIESPYSGVTSSTIATGSSSDVAIAVPTSTQDSVSDPIDITTPDEVPLLEEDVYEDTVQKPHPTSTEIVKEIVYVTSESTSDLNRYQFGASECVSVGDGSFYCSKQTQKTPELEDGVFAQKDSDGDLEIFIQKNGTATQVTHNSYDDASPYYDESAGELVFHRLIDGRYQIIRYDVVTGEEEQLTNSLVNNMEPVQSDGVTVWQTWNIDNWDIALMENGEVKVVSSNSRHDIAPTIRDGYAMWHTTNTSGEKLLSVYDIARGIASTIADPDGGHVENPRFVLVYDTQFENGDIVTKEYDPITGEIRPVGSQPAPLPEKIPTPDSTGETSALVNSKTNLRGENMEEFDETDSNNTGTTSSSTTKTMEALSGTISASSTSSVGTSTMTVSLASDTDTTLPLTDFDLIVEPYTDEPLDDFEAQSSTTVSTHATSS